eukprot:NODE_3772_length_733_cov_35.095029_g3175_i0.p2 GENE.NODE_3772_length_733_cov_35.095029_g3175_i0~~NODE_3772_length_733_cov_35.095029_g3175_i0.p2  ORF type:complete len:141 (-),score=32.96 NODE_3772_length_733_cov_35.095029_g3175_i0:128-550(-)
MGVCDGPMSVAELESASQWWRFESGHGSLEPFLRRELSARLLFAPDGDVCLRNERPSTYLQAGSPEKLRRSSHGASCSISSPPETIARVFPSPCRPSCAVCPDPQPKGLLGLHEELDRLMGSAEEQASREMALHCFWQLA